MSGSSLAPEPPPAACYILAVDDSEIDRRILTHALGKEGFAVVTVRDGREALDYLRAHPPPCLILLDVIMPRMDGFHFRAEQQQDARLASIPVVMLTSLVERDSHNDPANVLVLAKPVPPERLLEVVRTHRSA